MQISVSSLLHLVPVLTQRVPASHWPTARTQQRGLMQDLSVEQRRRRCSRLLRVGRPHVISQKAAETAVRKMSPLAARSVCSVSPSETRRFCGTDSALSGGFKSLSCTDSVQTDKPSESKQEQRFRRQNPFSEDG